MNEFAQDSTVPYKAEFDQFADEYQFIHSRSTRSFGENLEFFIEYKVADTAQLAKKFALGEQIRILDFGSGVGNAIPFFRKYLPQASLTCVDVSEQSLKIAKQRFLDTAEYQIFDGKRLPFPNNSFEIVFSACVFHHISTNEHVKLLKEIYRVLTFNGLFVIFEHNPLNPLTNRVVKECPFDKKAVLIQSNKLKKQVHTSGFKNINLKYRLFFPRIFKCFRFLEPFLDWIPVGAQYYLVGQKK